jgi:hypothetical protein
MFISDLAKKIKRSLVEHPEEWENEFLAIKHTSSGMELYFNFFSIEIWKARKLNIVEGFYLYGTARRLKNTLMDDSNSESNKTDKFFKEVD